MRERLCLYFCCQGTTRPLRVSSSISYTFPLGYQAVHLVTTQDVFNFNQSIKVAETVSHQEVRLKIGFDKWRVLNDLQCQADCANILTGEYTL